MECHKLCSRLNADLKAECPCAVRCPHGCPCEGYHGCPLLTTTASPSTTTTSVDATSRTSVLILSTYTNASAPILTDVAINEWVYPSGRGQFYFRLESKTEVFQSCSLIFAGRSYIYGGSNEKTQLSMVDGCALKRIGDLPFEFFRGACTSTPNAIYLCFESGSDYRTCRMATGDPAGPFEFIDKSIHDHRRISIASSESQ